MNALYNEIEPFAADWLERLAERGRIAAGRVERRSIADLAPADVAGSGQRHFFAGIGGWSYALRLAGVPDDADVWTGSCPCQPFSVAGRKGGTSDVRHLWPTWFDLIRECRPATIFGEQVAGADGLAWIDGVLTDLEGCGYTCGAAVIAAGGVSAPHGRHRLYFVAYAKGRRRGTRRDGVEGGRNAEQSGRLRSVGGLGDPDSQSGGRDTGAVLGAQGAHSGVRRGADGSRHASADMDPWRDAIWIDCNDGKRRPIPAQPAFFPLADGVPGRVGKLRGSGNAIVPQVAAAFIQAALDAIEER